MMNNFVIICILINIAIIVFGFAVFKSNRDNSSIERERLELEKQRLEFEKYKFDELETNKYTYLLNRMKHEMIIKTMEVENLNKMNIRDNETHNAEIQARLQERVIAIQNEKERIISEADVEIRKSQLETGLNFKEDIIDTFDNIIRVHVETHIYEKVLMRNDVDTINPEDILVPVGTQFDTQFNEIKSKIIDNLGIEATSIFDRYMKRDMWVNMLSDMLRVYWAKSINIVKSRKLQLAKSDNMNVFTNDNKKPLFINNQVNPNCDLSTEQYEIIKSLRLKNKAELEKVIEQVRADANNLYGTTYKPLLDINIKEYR